ncbi:TetR/AcrR family transcriptional regulator [Mycolicibacterium sp. P1-18]|uniref:TetR/AcrR family transcriptional regulator n=1 Tax=Mycolicibacterium sp. P1-18 TaxID=2024615 RepID=UPI0011F0C827|nr:TetR/AcrR family transcriptional regulator [Mycolicibacterium sp. P1-18]KAA0093250.1 TetR/AcrR family transcriptional regulator [Mycolicibacterium sp. P1-18]
MVERADAARNRQAVLDAAGRLFDDAAEVGAVSMDDVARAAGVGKGTLFRRFGDRTTLIRTVYDARLTELRTAVADGPPPLGPGTDPRVRIPALLEAIVDFKLDNRTLAMNLERDQRDGAATLYTSPSYVEMHGVLSNLLTEVIGADEAAWLGYALLAATRVDLVDHLVTTEGMTRDDLRRKVRALVERVLSPAKG